MPNGNIVTDCGFGTFVGAMNYCTILNIHLIAQSDAIHITSNHSVEPETAGISTNKIANYCGIFSYKTVIAKLRFKTS